MSKQLILLRHARAEWPPGQKTDDLKKPLNPIGEKQVPLVGIMLRDRNIKPDLIISSPAIRAITTARIIAEYLNYAKSQIVQDQRIYENTLHDLIDLIREIDNDKNCVLLVGHNPALSLLAATLCHNSAPELSNCSVCQIDTTYEDWDSVSKGQGYCSVYHPPEI